MRNSISYNVGAIEGLTEALSNRIKDMKLSTSERKDLELIIERIRETSQEIFEIEVERYKLIGGVMHLLFVK